MVKRIVYGVLAIGAVGAAVAALRGQAVDVKAAAPELRTVREYVAEDAKTRLADEYVIDMPISGTFRRLDLEVGDWVEAGQVIARVDPYPIEQEIREIEARIAGARAQIIGVDVNKPKNEDIEGARARVQEMENTLEVARRNLDVVSVNLHDTERSFARARGLLEAGATSQSVFDEAEAAFRGLVREEERGRAQMDAAERALEQARLAYQRLAGSIDDNEYEREALLAEIEAYSAQLAKRMDDLKKTNIRSPASGPVLEKYIEDERVLAAGTPLLRVGDMDSVEIECDVLSEEISEVRAGNLVEISGKALGARVVPGNVSRIYPSGFMKISALGVEQQRVRTIIAFDNTEIGLRPGTSVDVKIVTAEAKESLAVPDRALFRREGQWSLFVAADGRAQAAPVEVGLRNEDWAEIVSGLDAGAMVITELTNEIDGGVRVNVTD